MRTSKNRILTTHVGSLPRPHDLPGVITHASSVVEHPDYSAERIIRFADRCERKNVIASTDCGFSSQAIYKTEVENRVVWAKLATLAEGARIASERLWG